MPPELLFVYGTLMRGIQSSMSAFLSQHATFLQTAEYPGYLFDLGRYPGFIPDRSAKESVKGQLFGLRSPVDILPVLDQYEGIHEAAPEYLRKKLPFGDLEAWTYVFVGDTQHLTKIPGGDYRAYYRHHSAHQHFIQSKP